MTAPVYVVMWLDRHTDPKPEVWADRCAAIARARAIVQEYADEDRIIDEAFEEQEPGPDDWLYYAKWNYEDDYVFVVERAVRT